MADGVHQAGHGQFEVVGRGQQQLVAALQGVRELVDGLRAGW